MQRLRGLLALTATILIVPIALTIARAQLAGPPAARRAQEQAVAKKAAPQAMPAADRPALASPMPIRLVDTQGRPVQGAVAGTSFYRNADPRPRFVPAGSVKAMSDARGELQLEVRRDVHRRGIYAIRYDGDRALVGVYKPALEDVGLGKPVTIVMHPACRVRLRVECPGFRDVGKKYLVEARGERWQRLVGVILGDDVANQNLFTALSMTGELEFLLPPGRFVIWAVGEGTDRVDVPVAIEPGHRVRSLGVIDLSLSNTARHGMFFDHHHLTPTDRPAVVGGDEAAGFLRLRFVHRGPEFRGNQSMVHDLAYSPDGQTLATAHWNNIAAGGVTLWNASTGDLAECLPTPVETGGVENLAFSPDGRMLAGMVGDSADPSAPWVIVLWDIASRRELRTLRGHASRITAMAFAPDGRTLTTGGDDAVIRFWDVASGRETGRIEANPGAIQSIAYAPDGETLAIVSRFALKLWDVPGNRFRATLENGDFWVNAVAFAPDGRTLAAAGANYGANHRKPEGRVRLYDMTRNPPVRRAELVLRFDGPVFANPVRADLPFTAVAFTPDGRRVTAMVSWSIVVWDAETGARQDFIQRHGGGPSDRLAVSPDGRWLAVTEGHRAKVIDLVPLGE